MRVSEYKYDVATIIIQNLQHNIHNKTVGYSTSRTRDMVRGTTL